MWNTTNFIKTTRIWNRLSGSNKRSWRTLKWKLEMCIRPRVKYKGKLIGGMHIWTKNYINEWLLMKNYTSF
jgi:hypothetical protein